jgi:acyl-CoA thioesterase
MASLRDDTTLQRTSDGGFTRTIGPAWDGTSGALGGHTLALIVAAMTETLRDASSPAHEQTITLITAEFLRPVAIGDVTISVELVRLGRSTSNWRVVVASGDRVGIVATVLSTTPRVDARFDGTTAPMVERPGPGETPWDPGIGMSAHDQFDFYPRFAQSTDAVGGGWVLPRADFPNDARLVAMVSDLWLPPVLERLDPPAMVVGLACTLQFRTPRIEHVLVPGDPVLVRLSTRMAANGTTDETGEVWSVDGTLLATSLHLRLILPAT